MTEFARPAQTQSKLGRIGEVGMAFRQARQGKIASELPAVVAGFEALTGENASLS